MRVSTREHGVLKLVHPGRHVEIHRQPVTAAQIMKKYPRHCIARPDVFQFPWIVVRPESVLHPGKVFYLVPHWTLYKLLKNARKRLTQPASPENQLSRNDCHQHCRSGQSSRIKCWGGIAPKHRKHGANEFGRRRRLPESLPQDRKNSHDQDSEGYESDTSYVNAWGQLTDRIRKLQLTSFQDSSIDSSFDSSEIFRQRILQNSATNVHVPSTLAVVRREVSQHAGNPEARMRLRSCFRKQDSGRRLLNLRVTFGTPVVIPLLESASLEQAIWDLQ